MFTCQFCFFHSTWRSVMFIHHSHSVNEVFVSTTWGMRMILPETSCQCWNFKILLVKYRAPVKFWFSSFHLWKWIGIWLFQCWWHQVSNKVRYVVGTSLAELCGLKCRVIYRRYTMLLKQNSCWQLWSWPWDDHYLQSQRCMTSQYVEPGTWEKWMWRHNIRSVENIYTSIVVILL